MQTEHQLTIGWLVLGLGLAASAGGAPTGATVVNGLAGFNQQGNVLTITNTPGTIINWSSFSIPKGETARFVQQSAASSVPNRTTGANPSLILGALQSNGSVTRISSNLFISRISQQAGSSATLYSVATTINPAQITGTLQTNPGVSLINPTGAISLGAGAVFTVSGGPINYTGAGNPRNTGGVVTSSTGTITLGSGTIGGNITTAGTARNANAAVMGTDGSVRLTFVP